MKSTNKALKAVDAEYAAALKEYEDARKRLAAAGAARTEAHLAVEFAASVEGQQAASMTDAEWEAKKQRIEAARGPQLEPEVFTPGAGQ